MLNNTTTTIKYAMAAIAVIGVFALGRASKQCDPVEIITTTDTTRSVTSEKHEVPIPPVSGSTKATAVKGSTRLTNDSLFRYKDVRNGDTLFAEVDLLTGLLTYESRRAPLFFYEQDTSLSVHTYKQSVYIKKPIFTVGGYGGYQVWPEVLMPERIWLGLEARVYLGDLQVWARGQMNLHAQGMAVVGVSANIYEIIQ